MRSFYKGRSRVAQYVKKIKMKKTIQNYIELKTIATGGRIKARQLKSKILTIFNVSISASSIVYYRNRIGFKRRRMRSRPELNDLQKQQRLAFARQFENAAYNNWLFVDETAVFSHQNPINHMRKKSSRPKVVGIWNRSNKKVNIWGGIGWNGSIRFVLFTHNLTAAGYEYIIDNHLAPFIQNNYDECILIQDNDSKHTDNLSTDALRAHGIHWERTAAFSPDLNIIELVWSDLKRFIRERNCVNIDDLVVSIRLFEQKMTPEYNRRYIEHLRKVLRVIIQRNGDWSDH